VNHPLGFVTALPAEGRTLSRRRLGYDCLHRLPSDHWLSVSGTGPANARQAASRLIERGAAALVSWGCAAALDSGLRSGDLILASRILGADGAEYAADAAWRTRIERALSAELTVAAGTLAESAAIVASAADKRALRSATGAVAVDMESAAVAAAAESSGLPFLAVRAVADSASMKLPRSVLVAIDARGAVSLPKLLSYSLVHPAEFVELARLGRAFGAAMKTLGLVADGLGPDLSFFAAD
jgi:adenosylhomocysteine nucleosidase